MKLFDVLDRTEYKTELGNTEVSSLIRDSRMVEENSLFFCIKGVQSDGHDYAESALEKGALGIVVEKDLGLPKQIIIDSTHYVYAIACGNFFGNPAEKLKLLGVTGTNGKTTITYIVKGILEACGKKVGLIGTIENQIGDVSLQARHTTPDPHQLHAFFARMVEAGCEYVIMEVSSHSLEQERVAGLKFESATFTNLTKDHLDYHGTMENYFTAKSKLFHMAKSAVLNLDDKKGEQLYNTLDIPKIGFSLGDIEADLTAHNIKISEKGSNFAMLYGDELLKVEFVQPGLFSVSNALAAAGLCISAGISPTDAAKGLSKCPSIPGRFELIPTDTDFTVIRDFAHSTDGLKNLLSTVKEFAPGRIVTLFGCAGERDRTKRSDMADIVAKYSDFCIMTADNPRSEPIKQILDDAMPGLEKNDTDYKVFEDRYEAIEWALENSSKDDYLILAGKGHEDYQVLEYGSINFNEKELVQELLKNKNKN